VKYGQFITDFAVNTTTMFYLRRTKQLP